MREGAAMKLRWLLSLLVLPAMFCLPLPLLSADMDFAKSVTIGSGPKTVVEFTDPDCPFCRKASQYFAQRSDVTRHIFFYPLPRHPRAKEKAQYILSQHDKARAYHEVMSGRLDNVPRLQILPKGVRLQEEQMETAQRAKVTSTPTFIINGRIIEGFELKRIEEVLGPK